MATIDDDDDDIVVFDASSHPHPIHEPTLNSPTPSNASNFPMKRVALICLVIFCTSVAVTQLYAYAGLASKDFFAAQGKPLTESEVGYYSGFLCASQLLGCFVSGLFWGRASDKYGRRKVIIFCLLANAATTVLFGLSRSFSFAIFARLLCGLLDGSLQASKAMIADITDSSSQAKAFSTIGLSWGLGCSFGPLIGGLFYRRLSDSVEFPCLLPCLASASLTLVGCFVITLLLQNSNDDSVRQAKEEANFAMQFAKHKKQILSSDFIMSEEEEVARSRLRANSLQTKIWKALYLVLPFEAIKARAYGFQRLDEDSPANAQQMSPISNPSSLQVNEASPFEEDDEEEQETGIPHAVLQRQNSGKLSREEQKQREATLYAQELEEALHRAGSVELDRENLSQGAPIGHDSHSSNSNHIRHKPTLKQSLDSRVRTALAIFVLVAFVWTVLDEVFPLWCIKSRAAGGLSFSSTQIGEAEGVRGILILLSQVFFYPVAADKLWGKVGACKKACVVSMIMLPFLPDISSLSSSSSNIDASSSAWLLDVLIFLSALVRAVGSTFLFTSADIIVTNSVSTPAHLGVVAGACQAMASLIKGLGAAAGAALFAWSSTSNLSFPFDQHFVFLILSLALATTYILLRRLPESIERPRSLPSPDLDQGSKENQPRLSAVVDGFDDAA